VTSEIANHGSRAFPDPIRDRAFIPHPGQAQKVFLMLFVQDIHRVINGDDPHQSPASIDHRTGNQVILVEHIGDIALGIGGRNGTKAVLDDRAQRHIAPRRQDPAQRDIAHRLHPRVNQDHMVELIGQAFCRPQMVNRVAHRPMFGGHHHLALHQPPGGPFGIGQRLLYRDPVGNRKRAKYLFLPFRFKILKDINDIIGVERTNRLSHHGIGQGVNHLFADRPIQFRQHIAINPPRPKRQKRAAVMGIHLF
jgi:hypothetical protein